MSHTLIMLGDSVARALNDTVNPRGTIAAEAGGLDEPAWRQLERLGVVGADAAQMSMAELAVVIDAVAAAGALVPYADSEALARWLSSAADLDLDAAMLTAAVADNAQVQFGPRQVRVAADGLCIPWGCRANAVLFSFRAGERCYVGVKSAREIEQRRTPSLSGEPHGIVIGAVEIATGDVHEVSAARGPEAVLQRGALCRALQMVGAMTRVNALTLQYARDRKQFKRSLSDFQVIQSHLAAMAGELCAAAVAVETAVEAATSDDAFPAIATAKVRAGQAARQVAALGHQIHGAIGFTQEYPLNLWTRRLWGWREEYGNEAHWAAALGARCIEQGADALWPRLTAEGVSHYD